MALSQRMVLLVAFCNVSAVIAQAPLASDPPETAQSKLQTPASQLPILTLRGTGTQVYRCQPHDGGAFQWSFQAPVARLFDAQDREVGTHGDGPTWTYQDSSSIGGKVLAQATLDSANIPSLLLVAINPKRTGVLTGVEYIRRSDTHGGLAPATGCDVAHEGDLTRIPYTATYTFYSSKPANGS